MTLLLRDFQRHLNFYSHNDAKGMRKGDENNGRKDKSERNKQNNSHGFSYVVNKVNIVHNTGIAVHTREEKIFGWTRKVKLFYNALSDIISQT